MDEQRLDRRRLTFAGAPCLDVQPGAEIMEAIRGFNSHLADLGASTARRLVGLAGLPLADIAASVNEVRRIRGELRLPGIILPGDFPQYRTSAIQLQSQVAQNVLTLILSDIQEIWPRLSFQLVNPGGTIPFIVERMEAIARHRNPDHPIPTARLRNLWYDCASLGSRALEAAVDLYGADRMVGLADFPG